MPRPGQTCSGGGAELHWGRQCLSYSPVLRASAEPAFADLEQVIADSFDSWMAVRCDGEPVPLEVVQSERRVSCDQAQHNEGAGNANVVAFVRDWEARDYPREAFGLTLVWHDPKTGEILDADMMINETLGELTLCELNDCPSGAVDVQNVVTHEAGHFFGLGHSYSRTSAMFFEARTGETRKRFLNEDDAEGLCAIYAGLEAPQCTERAFRPIGGLRTSCLEEGGCSVGASGSGRGATPAREALVPVAFVLGWVALRRRRRPGR